MEPLQAISSKSFNHALNGRLAMESSSPYVPPNHMPGKYPGSVSGRYSLFVTHFEKKTLKNILDAASRVP